MAGFIAIACTISVFQLTGYEAPPSPPDTGPRGNDLADLSRLRPMTDNRVIGTITVNQQFPLGVGIVVGYDSRMSAVAESKLDKFGNYELRNLPPGRITLLVKRTLNDHPNPMSRENVSEGRTPSVNQSIPKFLVQKTPSAASLKKIKFDVYTPEFDRMEEVKWMVSYAFYKYGSFSKTTHLVIPPEEGERVHLIDLKVP